MNSCEICLSNGEKLTVNENSILYPVFLLPKDGSISYSKEQPIKLNVHISEGLIPSILEGISGCNFFVFNNKTYSTQAITSFEII